MPQSTVSSAWLKTLCNMFAAEGVATDLLLADVRLSPAQLDDSQARFSVDTLVQMWDRAQELAGSSQLGLRRELCDQLVGFYEFGYGMMACATLQDAIKLLVEYFALLSNDAQMRLEPSEEGLWIEFSLLEPHPAVRNRAEFGSLMTLRIFSLFVRQDIEPIKIRWTFPPPVDSDYYEREFGAPTQFNDTVNAILICNEDLDRPLPTASEGMYHAQLDYLNAQVARLGVDPDYQRVYDAISRSLSKGEPRCADIALALHMSERTLHRRLQNLETSFKRIVDDVRAAQARHFLAYDRLTLQEISARLGFNDIRNFYRFSSRVLGKPPGEYRDRMSGV